MNTEESMNRLTEERDLLLEQKHYLSEDLIRSIEQIQKEKQTYDDAVRTIKVLKKQIEGLIEKEQSALHTLELCKDEIHLLNHILSINKIQLTPDVVQDAENHLRELTREMIE